MGENAHCLPMESNGVLEPYWGWIATAAYEGERPVHERPLDIWGTTVSVYVHLPHKVRLLSGSDLLYAFLF